MNSSSHRSLVDPFRCWARLIVFKPRPVISKFHFLLRFVAVWLAGTAGVMAAGDWGYSGYLNSPVPQEIAVPLAGVVKIAAGGYHTVALKNDGTVVAWGYNGYGQTTVPAGLSGVSAIAAGGLHTVALKNDGTVVAWGYNGYGQTMVPAGLSGVSAIAAGWNHTVALKNDGTVVAWGYNGNGQTMVPAGLSDVSAIAAGWNHTVALKNDGMVVAWGENGSGQTTVPAGLSGVSAIAAGESHTVALKNDGTVVAWGYNGNGQTMVPAGLSGVSAIAAGWHHTVALKNDGTVVAWGVNNSGQTTVPAGLSGVSAIAAGGFHTVALKNDGTVVAWGYNGYGQTMVPAGLSGVSAIAAGGAHTVALKNDGTVVAWGSNDYGQTTVPAGLSGVSAIAAGGSHTVALKNDGTVVAWGSNGFGQTTVPAGLSGVSAIATGGYHTVALKSDGIVVAWGYNDYGQTTVPAGLSGVSAIAAGGLHTVALKNDGTVVAWGYNYSGQTTVPAGLSGVSAIAAGGYHAVALKNDGTVVAWGDNNSGQTTVPAGLIGISAIAAGERHTVALKNDGTVVAWGYNGYGQTTVPAGLSGVSAIATGSPSHVTFYRTDASAPSPGQIDTTFSMDGKTTVAIAGSVNNEFAWGVAAQPDGKIVLGGVAGSGAGDDFAVVRLLADGSPDPGFDGDGKVLTPIGGGADLGRAIALQPDGKIVLAGQTHNGSNWEFAVVRYNPDGSLDTSFNTTGKVITPIGIDNDRAFAVALQPDGKIVVAGYAVMGGIINAHFALVRYNPDGSLDTTFSSDGIQTTAIGGIEDQAFGVVIQPDGKIVAVGYSYNGSNKDIALVRYHADGSLDSSFDGDGKMTMAIGGLDDIGYGITMQPDGKILVAGWTYNASNSDMALLRFNPDGSPDLSFNGSGRVITTYGGSFDFGNAPVVQANGKIVVAGYANNGSNDDFALSRYLPNGSLDTSFGNGGKITTAIGSDTDAAGAVALQPDGKIVAAGYSWNGSNNDMAVARYLGDDPDNLLVNGSFETLEALGGQVPTSPGDWGQDEATIVTAENGIVPFEGTRMAKHLSTAPGGPGGTGAEIVQFVDLSAYSAAIATGSLRVTLTNRVNRVAGDSNTDTRFGSSITARNGTPASGTVLGSNSVTLDSDANPVSWELMSNAFTVPVGTTHILVSVHAIENVVDDIGSPEFAGHYVDDVRLVALVNNPPVAQAGGPYLAGPNMDLELDGTGSSDPNTGSGDSIVSYEWDLNGDAVIDVTGVAPVVSWASLQSLGLGSDALYTISLRVTDTFGVAGTANTTLRIDATPPVLDPLNDLTVVQTGPGGATVTFTPAASDGGSGIASVDAAPASGSEFAVGTTAVNVTATDAAGNTDTDSFNVTVLAFNQDSDGDGLNDASEFQMAALGFDWQASQPALVDTLLDNANGAGLFTPAQVQALHVGTPLISRDPVTGKFKLTMDWKKSTNLADFFDFPASANSVSVNPQGDIELEFTSPDDAAFFRLEAR